ncbi:MAG: glycoside hydrolase family 3 N-terminal domain-containing protein [Pikeienuella sp.]
MAAPLATIFGCEGLTLSARERAFFRAADPWGFILFRRNIDNPDQLRALTAEMRACVGRAAPVMIDQEGGRVARMRPPHWRKFGPAMADATGLYAEERLELRSRLIAHDLASVGIDANCAPLLDVATDEMHDAIGDRALGSDAAIVAKLGHAVRRGLMAGGVLPIVKHLPGYGRATVDPHEALPHVTAGRDALEADFAPFRDHADAPMGMTGHLVFDAIDPETVSTFSAPCIDLIRNEIGFDGLLMTDDLSMGALEGDIASRAARSRAAGCDMILHCNGDMAEMQAVAAHAGMLEGDALRRAQVVDAMPRDAVPLDVEQAAARYAELTLMSETANA